MLLDQSASWFEKNPNLLSIHFGNDVGPLISISSVPFASPVVSLPLFPSSSPIHLILSPSPPRKNKIILTHRNPSQQHLQKRIIPTQILNNLLIMADINEHRERILRNRRIVLDEKFQVFDGLELVALEEGEVRRR